MNVKTPRLEKKSNCITLDYLEFFCQQKQLVIGCRRGEEEVWISPLGPHPSDLTSDELHDILKTTSLFEIRKMLEGEVESVDSEFLTRKELEQLIRRMMN